MDSSPRYRRFRAMLRQIREEAGLNQAALATKLGKPQTFISKAELGERRIDFLETLEFCVACNISLPQFLARLENAKTATKPTAKAKRRTGSKVAAKAG